MFSLLLLVYHYCLDLIKLDLRKMVKWIEIPTSARKIALDLYLKSSSHRRSKYSHITLTIINWLHFVIITQCCHFLSICTTMFLQLCHLYLTRHLFLPFDDHTQPQRSASCLVLAHIKTRWMQTNGMKKWELWVSKSSHQQVVWWKLMLGDRCARHSKRTFSQLSLPNRAQSEEKLTVVKSSQLLLSQLQKEHGCCDVEHCICTPATSTVTLCVTQPNQGKVTHCLTI